MIGHLEAALVNHRYRWSDLGVLRSACVEHTILTV